MLQSSNLAPMVGDHLVTFRFASHAQWDAVAQSGISHQRCSCLECSAIAVPKVKVKGSNPNTMNM